VCVCVAGGRGRADQSCLHPHWLERIHQMRDAHFRILRLRQAKNKASLPTKITKAERPERLSADCAVLFKIANTCSFT